MVHADQKVAAVCRLLEVEDFDALIAFVRTKQATLDLASALEAKPDSPILRATIKRLTGSEKP